MKISFTFTVNDVQIANIQAILGDEKTTPRADCVNWLWAHLEEELASLDHKRKLARVGVSEDKRRQENARKVYNNVAPAPQAPVPE